MNVGIFERNLKAMEKWYPSFAKMIREKKDIEDDTEVMTEVSWDGEIIFKIKKENRMLYLGGKRNAGEPIELWFEQIGKLPKYTPFFLFGLGNGAYLKKIINNTPKEVNVVAYEPSLKIFLKMLREIDLSHEIENRPIAFVVEELNVEEFEPVMNKVFVFENIEFLKQEIHPNYKVWYAEKITEKVRLLHRKAEEMVISYNTGISFSTHLAANVMNNMKYICDGYNTKRLSEVVPYDMPAILVSAGPSLNKNIKELKKAKNKAFLLAVDTALKPLLKEGIVPDAYVTIDANKPFHLIDVKGAQDIPVIAPTCAFYKIIEHQKGKKIFFNDGYVMPYEIYGVNHKRFYDVATGGSVACTGFSLLYKMGFDTIILVGQDLAFTDNKSHADGTFQEKMPTENTEDMLKVKGNYVDEVPTNTVFRMFLEWFNMYIKGAKEHRNIRVINATEGGAYIEGTEICTLKTILQEVCRKEVNFSEKINEMESEFSEEERKKAVDYLHSIPAEYGEIQKDAKQLQKEYEKLQKAAKGKCMEKEQLLKLLKKVKKLTKKCRGREAYQLIDMTMPAAEYIIRSEAFYESDSLKEEMAETARKGVMYSKLLQECAGVLKQMAEETLLPVS